MRARPPFRSSCRGTNVRPMSVVIAIDAGTTGVRSFALRPDGTPAGYAYREFPQHFPAPGWSSTTRTTSGTPPGPRSPS